MSHAGKEIERQIVTSETTATKEVENYIERVERGTERTGQDSQTTQSKPKYGGDDLNQQSDSGTMLPVSPVAVKKIVLPLTEEGISRGLKGSFVEGLRWLAEWCVMIIKKYPGRVFYSSPTNRGYD